jgi:predicted MFS family arabinose efflux permease
MISFGLADTLGSYLFGYIIKYVGRVPCFLLAALMNYAMIIFMMLWEPSSDQIYILFIIAIFWGLSDAV